MWLLRHDGKGLIYRVTPGRNHIISRKEGDLLLQDDQSISRKHALLYVDNDNVNEGVKLKDLESKYGTFTNIGDGELTRLAGNQEITLGSGDVVRFGIQWNSWRLEFVPLLVATSTLSQEEKAEVRQMVAELGGTLTRDWQQDCTHLTMNKLTVTVKVVCALAAGQPIVTPAYWRAVCQALSTLQTTLPDCANYQPPLAEAMLNPTEVCFNPNPERGSLFKSYTFVASTSKQLSRIKPMITAAGGKVDLYSPTAWSESNFLGRKVVLMQHSMHEKMGSQQSQIPDGYVNIARNLKVQGVRTIPESEIGLSVLHCSVSQYCNPQYNVRAVLSSSSSLEPTQPINVLCPNTEASSNSQDVSMDALTEPNVCNKRPHEHDIEDDQPAIKKQNTRDNSEDLFGSQNINNTPSSSDTNKRRLRLRKIKSPVNGCSTSGTDFQQSSSLKAGSSSSMKQIESNVRPVQSLDMFAPSGSRSKPVQSEMPDEVRPSCRDMFASGGSRKTGNENPAAEDEFSFEKSKRHNRPQENQVDEFSFKKQKINKNVPSGSNDEDEFSFTKNKLFQKRKHEVVANKDEFSFTSSRVSKKRNHQGNMNKFDSKPPVKISVAGTSKIAVVENDDNFEDNMFDFTTNHMSKRQRLSNVPKTDTVASDIKIAMFTKANGSELNSKARQSGSELQYEATEMNNLVTYSKSMHVPAKIKQEANEELDELVKELENATIVVVKSLVKPRNNVAQTDEPGGTGKNFKKFCKVKPLNKRIVPHIIGGSDLVPHNQMIVSTADDNLLPDSPQRQETSDDEWNFLRNKGRSH